MGEINICKYSPDRELDYYAAGLAGIMGPIGWNRGGSTYAYTKEVRKALETLMYTVWDIYEEYLESIVRSNIPNELRSNTARECFAELLKGLVKRFRETTDKLPAGARIKLMNMVIASIAETAQESEGGET